MYMIINTGGNGGVTAETVKYDDGTVAQALNTLEDELTANGTRIYLDYKDGQYGYNTDALRGADTFSPFKSGGGDFTVLNTRYSISGSSLPTINGCGYCTLKRMTGENNNFMRVFIDGNTTGFEVAGGSTMTYFFQKSIRFESNLSSNTYLIQTLLADKSIADKYVITQGIAGEQLTDIRGKGKLLIASGDYNTVLDFYIDSGTKKSFTVMNEDGVTEIVFNSRIRFNSDSDYYPLYYILYLEV